MSATRETIAAAEIHTGTIIFIHGLGQNTQTWRDVIIHPLAPRFSHVEWILPQASDKMVTFDDKMVTFDDAMEPSWFNISTLPPGDDKFDEPAIQESIAIIEEHILAQIQRGIDPRKIVLVGFSQGASLSLMVGLKTSYNPGGIVSLAGWIPPRARTQMISCPDVPIIWCHGLVDNQIPIEYAEDVIRFLEDKMTSKLALKKYPGLAHAVDERVVEDLGGG
uniref:Acyl-protein thioesterase 1 n=1 Tax=Mycena chlorophos TaxID=658473 RepID=A0ABQ0KY37_MYCCL|nr:phospholipase/carboxylesterase [Mycena chlorophos]